MIAFAILVAYWLPPIPAVTAALVAYPLALLLEGVRHHAHRT